MAFTSTAQSLVVELLSDIFLECLPMDGLARIRLKEVPLTVSHVCRHWRFVSLSTCRLWARLNLRCASNETTLEYAHPILQAFLQRSGCADFYIKIDCADDLRLATPKTVVSWPTTEVIFHELARQSDRIKGIILTVPQTLWDHALEFSFNALPALDHLSLQLLGDAYRRKNLDKTFWKVVSRLRSLELKSPVLFKYDPDDIEISTLKHLDFNSCSHQALFQILKSCPALESLHFNAVAYSQIDSTLPVNTKERRFPSIKYLKVTTDDGTALYNLREFFRDVQLPNLRRFTVTVRKSDDIEPSLEAFLAASRPSLEELYLINTEPSYKGAPLVRILKLLPSVKKLRIMLDPEIMRALVLFGGGEKGTCPLLEEVTLDIKEMSFEESVQLWTATEDMIRSRWQAPKSRLSTTSRSRTSMPTHSITAPRKLRKIILPDIKEEHWKRHQLYKCIKDCQRQGLVFSFRDDGH